MKYKKAIPFVVYSILALIGYAIAFPDKLGICSLLYNPNCYYNFPLFTLGEPLLSFFLYASVASLPLIFVGKTLFVRWLKVSTMWTVISFFILRTLPVYDQQALPIFSFTRGDTSKIFGQLFVIITIIIVAHYFLQKRSSEKSMNKKLG